MKRFSRFLLVCFYFLLLGYQDACQAAYFNNLLTLAEFGIAVNLNTSLQSTSRYTSDPIGQILRTNDYQTLQLNFGDYATGRLPCRVGLFNVSQSFFSVGNAPFGPRIALPGFTRAGNQGLNIEPNRFIEQVREPQELTFSFTEDLTGITYDIEESETFVACNVTYESTDGNFMQDINLPISAYHDVRYDNLTPVLTFGSAILTELTVDGSNIVLPTTNEILALPAGSKFKFVFEGVNPSFSQEWLLYVQSEIGTTTLQFDMQYELDKHDRIINVQLVSQSDPYTGYIRVGAIQNGSPYSITNNIRPRTTPKWQLVTQLQTMPVTPLAIFMLWPYDWTKSVGFQLVHNQSGQVFLSDCKTVSLLLPLLARSNLTEALCWFDQLIDMQQKGEVTFDPSTNPFITLMNMFVSGYYDTEIKNYQAGLDRGLSTPRLGIQQDISAMESMYDDHKSLVVISAELDFEADGNYSYLVQPFDIVGTFPEASNSLPLFCTPGFKSVADGFNVVANATNHDPIKGDINYLEGNHGSIPGSYLIKFKAQDPPSFSTRFLPDDLWLRLKGSDKTNLSLQLNCALQQAFPPISNSVYDEGLILFEKAVTAKFATYVLLAQLGILPPYPRGFVAPSEVSSKVQPLLDYIQDVLDAWLITRVFGVQSLSNYFVADNDAKGIVAFSGTTSATGGVQDSGNAVYTGHNRQYGYFLGSAALKIELDRLFGNASWLSSSATNTVGTTATVKQYLDMLWRDYANPDPEDPDAMPFYRYGNPWEGMSSSKGVPPVGAFESRNNESISEDFNGYYAAWLYSRAVQDAPLSEVSSINKEGFPILERFSKTNLDMIMRAARGMYYNTDVWVYKNSPINFNKTTGTVWDTLVDSNVDLQIGSPPCILTKEGCLYSNYKFEVFFEDMVDSFNNTCQCTNEGCSCQK